MEAGFPGRSIRVYYRSSMTQKQTPLSPPPAEIELEIERLAFQGCAVGRSRGLVYFVADALPGERVRARVTRRAARVAFAETVEVLRASPRRRSPPCPVFGRCGGCHLLHADYALQVEAKTQFVRDAFRRWPELAARVRDCAPAPEPLRYRNRMSYSIACAAGEPVIGLHARNAAGGDAPLCDALRCLIAPAWHREVLEHTLAALRHAGGDPAQWPRRLDLREGRRTGQRMATFWPPPPPAFAERWLAGVPAGIVTVVFSEPPDPRGAAVRCRPVRGSGWIEERLERWTFRIGPHTFFQTNTEAAESLFRAAAAAAAETKPRRVVELYAGVGALTVFLASVADAVIALERHRPSVAAARGNLRRNRIANVRFHGGPAAEFRPRGAAEAADLVVVDPPRGGLDAGARAAVASWSAPRLMYISCDPMTLARDAEALRSVGYELRWVQPFDLFPQTFHVESLAVLEKRG